MAQSRDMCWRFTTAVVLAVAIAVMCQPIASSPAEAQEQGPLPEGKPVLRIGVAELPEFMSPALAWTDAEREAVELLYESLMQARESAKLGQFYEPVLAAVPPQVIPGGRRFTLRPDACWPSGEHVTAADVRATVELLRQQSLCGTAFLWNDVLGPPKVSGNPPQLDFIFNQPFFDPLLPFTFKVLPATYEGKPLAMANELDFARSPVGSGPFAYVNPDKGAPKEPVRFVVNKHHPYSQQKSGFAEIQFVRSTDPLAELSDPKTPVHLILGLTEARVAYLMKHHVGQIRSVGNRRVHFLAVNHRNKALQDRDLRKGLAAALNRQLLLDLCFRGKDPAYDLMTTTGAGPGAAADFLRQKLPPFHRVLNGPFPANSWALKPEVPTDLHAPDQALSFLRQAKDHLKALTLTLACPANDLRVVQACRLMAEQIQAAAAKAEFELKLELKPLPPHQLREAVYNHDYDLAYFQWDFGSEYYWLWPLFSDDETALEKKGSNFLGYEDADLLGLLRKRMSYREFAPLKKVSHLIHAHLVDRMPLIPLWQLDMHAAVHPSLDLGDDLAWPFCTTATQWRLKPG